MLVRKESALIYREDTLSTESAKAIITATFPQFHGMHVELLGEGYDFRVFEVDEGLLFRFPKRKASVTKLIMESRLLLGLGKWVSLPVPSHEYIGESRNSSGRPFAGYRKLLGIAGDVAETVDWHMVARQLGLFLDKLHTYPVDRAREAGVSVQSDLMAHWHDRAFEELNRSVDLNIDIHDLRRYLENGVSSPFGDAPRLVHNDLWAEHILVDLRSGGVSGIIDWGDAVIGDPALDFACLYTWRGESWLESVLESYPGTLDSEVISRARYLATCQAIHCITLGRDLLHLPWIKAGQEALRLVFAT